MAKLQISASKRTVATYDLHEVKVTFPEGPASRVFDADWLSGTFARDGAPAKPVRGFCDSADGRVWRIRFMPDQPGPYHYTLHLGQGASASVHEGSFEARPSANRGVLQTDPAYPYHFKWSGTGRHFFWCGTTAYLMAGLSDERIVQAIDRLARLGVNRIRVSLGPTRQLDGGRWFEPQVKNRADFTFNFGPWVAARPDDAMNPGYDVTRFNLAHWQKYERLLAHARKRGLQVQVIFFTDAQEDQNYPFSRGRIGDDPDERRYYAYAAARLSAFANIDWCLTNEWALFRPDSWADAVGPWLESQDPYGHLISIHGHGHFPFRKSAWCDFALFQSWDEHGAYDFMLKNRKESAEAGKPMPQINEEYGYEDHYPGPWGEGRVAPARSKENRARLAWEMTMAGAYQTTGESSHNGLGGWINGLGDDSMTMLPLYRNMRRFFEAIEWWKLNPADAPAGARRLTGPDGTTVLYLDQGGSVEIELKDATYRLRQFGVLEGKGRSLGTFTGNRWKTPRIPAGRPIAFLIQPVR